MSNLVGQRLFQRGRRRQHGARQRRRMPVDHGTPGMVYDLRAHGRGPVADGEPGELFHCGHGYSALAPESLTTFSHLAVSLRMYSPNWAGVDATGSAP
jgi:hypothetical protein